MGVIGKRRPPWTVEELARKIAFWHGQKKVENGQTVAALHGYGSWGHSPERFADFHWHEYASAAEIILSDLKSKKVKCL